MNINDKWMCVLAIKNGPSGIDMDWPIPAWLKLFRSAEVLLLIRFIGLHIYITRPKVSTTSLPRPRFICNAYCLYKGSKLELSREGTPWYTLLELDAWESHDVWSKTNSNCIHIVEALGVEVRWS